MKKCLFIFLFFLYGPAWATNMSFTSGFFSTSFDGLTDDNTSIAPGADFETDQDDSGGTDSGLQGLIQKFGGQTTTCSPNYTSSVITTADNYSGGGGGRGFGQYFGLGYPTTPSGTDYTPYMSLELPANTTELWWRYYVRLDTNEYTDCKVAYIRATTNLTKIYLHFLSTDGLRTVDGGSTLGTCANCGFVTGFGSGGQYYPANEWHSIEIHVDTTVTGTDFQVWLDDVLVWDTNFSYELQHIDEIDFMQSYHGHTVGCAKMSFDDIAVALPSYTGFIGSGNNTRIGPVGGGGADTTPPEVNTATIGTNGTAFTIVYNENVTQGAGYNDSDLDVDCTAGGNNIGLTYVSGDGTATHVYTLASTVNSGDTCNLDFNGDANSLEDAANNDLAAITSLVVTNSSTQTPSGLDTSSYTLLLDDGFESGDTANWQCAWFYQQGGATVQGTTVHTGSYALQLPSGNQGVHAHCFSPSYDNVIFDAWMNYDSSVTQAAKYFEGANFDGGQGICTTAAGTTKPNSWAPFYTIGQVHTDDKPFSYWVRSDGLTVDPYNCDNTQTDGAIWQNDFQNQGNDYTWTYGGGWHHVQQKIALNTIGQADGSIELWVDDVMRAQHTGLNLRGSFNDGINLFLITNHGATGGNLYFDDVKLWGNSVGDINPPAISDTNPSGTLVCQDPVEVTWSTHEPATCKYDTSDVAYDSMANTADETGLTTHRTFYSATCGQATTLYVRCEDAAANQNSSSMAITWTLQAASAGSCGVSSAAGGSAASNAAGTGSVSINP